MLNNFLRHHQKVSQLLRAVPLLFTPCSRRGTPRENESMTRPRWQLGPDAANHPGPCSPAASAPAPRGEPRRRRPRSPAARAARMPPGTQRPPDAHRTSSRESTCGRPAGSSGRPARLRGPAPPPAPSTPPPLTTAVPRVIYSQEGGKGTEGGRTREVQKQRPERAGQGLHHREAVPASAGRWRRPRRSQVSPGRVSAASGPSLLPRLHAHAQRGPSSPAAPHARPAGPERVRAGTRETPGLQPAHRGAPAPARHRERSAPPPACPRRPGASAGADPAERLAGRRGPPRNYLRAGLLRAAWRFVRHLEFCSSFGGGSSAGEPSAERGSWRRPPERRRG